MIMVFQCNRLIMKLTQVVAERFIRTLKGEIYKKMTENDSKSFLGNLNKLAHKYNNTYCRSIGKKAFDANYSALAEEIESNHQAP